MSKAGQQTPYLAHLFVCLNDRNGVRKSCADGGDAAQVRQQLKAACKERGWHNTKVRVSQSGCMGLCDRGPNVVIYPEMIWFSAVTSGDVARIMDAVERIVEAGD